MGGYFPECHVYRHDLRVSGLCVLRFFPPVDAGDYAATSGLVPVCVMAVSAAIMVVCGLLMKKFKWSWVNDYALPISLVLGMASAIPLTAWLG